uniref:Uncharacterized protein n=1 Tax=Cannabis sativa TaxID=3483 RepID=A0A803PB43_CANSA
MLFHNLLFGRTPATMAILCSFLVSLPTLVASTLKRWTLKAFNISLLNTFHACSRDSIVSRCMMLGQEFISELFPRGDRSRHQPFIPFVRCPFERHHEALARRFAYDPLHFYYLVKAIKMLTSPVDQWWLALPSSHFKIALDSILLGREEGLGFLRVEALRSEDSGVLFVKYLDTLSSSSLFAFFSPPLALFARLGVPQNGLSGVPPMPFACSGRLFQPQIPPAGVKKERRISGVLMLGHWRCERVKAARVRQAGMGCTGEIELILYKVRTSGSKRVLGQKKEGPIWHIRIPLWDIPGRAVKKTSGSQGLHGDPSDIGSH